MEVEEAEGWYAARWLGTGGVAMGMLEASDEHSTDCKGKDMGTDGRVVWRNLAMLYISCHEAEAEHQVQAKGVSAL